MAAKKLLTGCLVVVLVLVVGAGAAWWFLLRPMWNAGGEMLSGAKDWATSLDLGDNYIRTIPEEISQLQALRVLALWDNPINTYPQSLGELEKLEYLDLLHNQMNLITQERVRGLLPGTRIIFSPPCKCEDGE